MGEVVVLPSKREREVGLTYGQLGQFLLERGQPVSKRWLQARRAEGMPHFTDVAGRVRFYPSQAMPWLEAWAAQRGRKVG
jgi:hypothetical protein